MMLLLTCYFLGGKTLPSRVLLQHVCAAGSVLALPAVPLAHTKGLNPSCPSVRLYGKENTVVFHKMDKEAGLTVSTLENNSKQLKTVVLNLQISEVHLFP